MACLCLLWLNLDIYELVSCFTFFAKPKVSNLHISLRVQEQVVQLQISADEKEGIRFMLRTDVGINRMT